MGKKVRVPIAGTVGKSIFIETAGTVGAQIGVNLQLPDGSVPSLAELSLALGTSVAAAAPTSLNSLSWDNLGDVDTSAKITTSIPFFNGSKWVADNKLRYSSSDFRVFNAAADGHIKFIHSGAVGQLAIGGAGTTSIQIVGGPLGLPIPVTIQFGSTFKIEDFSQADSVTFDHDGVDLNTVFVQTTDWNIVGRLGIIHFGDDASPQLLNLSGPYAIPDRAINLQGDQNLDNVEYHLSIDDPTGNNRRARFFLSDEFGEFGLQASASSGVPTFGIYIGLGRTLALDNVAMDLLEKEAFRFDDDFLRINNASAFTSGVFIPSVLRVDNAVRIGTATQFVTIDGDGSDQNYSHTGTTRMGIQGVVNIIANSSVSLLERAAAEADVANYGQFFVKNDNPPTPYYADDVGVESQLAQLAIAQTVAADWTFSNIVTLSSYLQHPTFTDAELNAIANAVNTDPGKIQGAEVYNASQDVPVWAVGSADGSVWVDGAGATVNTPVA